MVPYTIDVVDNYDKLNSLEMQLSMRLERTLYPGMSYEPSVTCHTRKAQHDEQELVPYLFDMAGKSPFLRADTKSPPRLPRYSVSAVSVTALIV